MPKSKRWFVVSGLVLVLTGLWQVWEGWAGLRTQDLEGYESLGAGAFLVFLGICFFGVALGLVKLRGSRQ